MGVIVDKVINIGEDKGDVDTGILLKNNDWIDISASGSIWAGVWFTGENGPQGWTSHRAGADSPLPGTAPFSLLGKTAKDGYFYIGSGLRRTYLNASLGPARPA